MIDCGAPQFCAAGVIIYPFNNTKFGSLIAYNCEEENDTLITSLCSSNGEWIPNSNSYNRETPYSTTGNIVIIII